MKRRIALLICLFAMTTLSHQTHAAEASPHEEGPAKKRKRKADDFDGLTPEQIKKKKARAASNAAYRAANKDKKAARVKQKKLELLVAGNLVALASLQQRIDQAQDQPGAAENPFLSRYNEAYEEQMNPATPRSLNATDILLSLVTNLQSEQAALSQADDDSEEVGVANFKPRTPYQALEDLLSDSEESPVE
jgi:hypothetical protein